MKTDSLNRRARDIRQPKHDQNNEVKDRDVRWLSFLHRHGGRLPTSYLYDATKETHSCRFWSQERLKILYQEMKLIDRPWQQFEVRDSRMNELVHEISPLGIEELKSRGLFSEYAPTMGGHFKHQLYLGCISASVELNAREAGYVYIPQHHLLSEAKAQLQFTGSFGTFMPDGVFGLIIDGKMIVCFLEIDRSTEGNYHVASLKGKRWEQSIKQYEEVLNPGKRLYRDWLKVNCGAVLLIVTVSQDKQEKILNIIEEVHPRCSYMMVHNYPQFGKLFHPPTKLDVLGANWTRNGHPPFAFVKR